MKQEQLDGVLDRSQPPKTVISRLFKLPEFHRTTTGRLEVLVLRRPEVPIVSLSLVATRAGAAYQPNDSPGLASLAASTLTEGTSRSSAVEFADRAEALGGFVSSGSDWDAAAVHSGSLSKHLEDTMDLALEAYFDAAFRDSDIDRLKTRRLAEIARRNSDPGSIAGQEFIRRAYAKTPYAKPLIGTRSSLAEQSSETLSSFWQTQGQEQLSAVAVGDVDPDSIQQLLEERLSHLNAALISSDASAPCSPSKFPELVRTSPGVKVYLVDRPQSAQTQLIMGHPGPSRIHPDRPTLRLLNSVFGGKFSSRINLNLREEHGYTYGANSSFSARRGPGPFAIHSAVENEFVGDACREVLRELNRIRSEPVGSDELESARSYLLGVQPYSFQTNEGWVSALASLSVYDLPNSFYDGQQELLSRVTADQVLNAAQRHLHPDDLTVVAVGPVEQLEPQFHDFDSVEVSAETPDETPSH